MPIRALVAPDELITCSESWAAGNVVPLPYSRTFYSVYEWQVDDFERIERRELIRAA